MPTPLLPPPFSKYGPTSGEYVCCIPDDDPTPPLGYWAVQAHGWDLESSVEAFLTGDSSDARCVALVLCVAGCSRVLMLHVAGWLAAANTPG